MAVYMNASYHVLGSFASLNLSVKTLFASIKSRFPSGTPLGPSISELPVPKSLFFQSFPKIT